MLINFKQLNNLPVETRTKQALGKLESIIIDIDNQNIYQYIVKPSGIKNIFEKELLISREQIVNITKDKIIVEDGTYTLPIETKKENTKPKTQLQPEPVTRK